VVNQECAVGTLGHTVGGAPGAQFAGGNTTKLFSAPQPQGAVALEEADNLVQLRCGLELFSREEGLRLPEGRAVTMAELQDVALGCDENVILGEEGDGQSVVRDNRTVLGPDRLEPFRPSDVQPAVQCDPQPPRCIQGHAAHSFGGQAEWSVIGDEGGAVKTKQAAVGAHPEVSSGIRDKVACGEIR